MISSVWPTVNIRADEDGTGQFGLYDDYLNATSPASILVEDGSTPRLAVRLSAAVDMIYTGVAGASTSDWKAILPNVPGLEFWTAATGGSQLTPDGNDNLIDQPLSSDGQFTQTIYASFDPSLVTSVSVSQIGFTVDWFDPGAQFSSQFAPAAQVSPAVDPAPSAPTGSVTKDIQVGPSEQDAFERAHGIDPDARLTTNQKSLLATATAQLKNSGLSAAQQDVRIEVLEAVLTGTVQLPAGGTVGTRNPTCWTNPAGNAHDHYVVAAGQTAERAIDDMWDGLYTPKVWCWKYSSLIMVEGLFRYFQGQGNLAGINALNGIIGNKIIPSGLPSYGNGTLWTVRPEEDAPATGYALSSLLPGDQIWFQNPYFEQGKAILVQNARAAAIAAGKSQAEINKAVAAAEALATGEEGSNVFYIGNDQVVRIYGDHTRTYTIEEYESWVMSDNTVQAYIAAGHQVSPSDFKIMRVRSVIDPSTIG